MLGNQDFRRILHLTQTVLLHLEDTQFGGGTKTVFDTAHHAITVMLVALKLQHRIHDVFQKLWTRKSAVFGDVTDKEYGASGAFGEVLELGRTLLELRNRTRRRLQQIALHCLNGIHNEDIGLQSFDMLENLLGVCFGEDGAVRSRHVREAGGTHLELRLALLARHIEHLLTLQAQSHL